METNSQLPVWRIIFGNNCQSLSDKEKFNQSKASNLMERRWTKLTEIWTSWWWAVPSFGQAYLWWVSVKVLTCYTTFMMKCSMKVLFNWPIDPMPVKTLESSGEEEVFCPGKAERAEREWDEVRQTGQKKIIICKTRERGPSLAPPGIICTFF